MSAEQIAAFSDDMHALFLQRCRGFGTDVKFGEVLRESSRSCASSTRHTTRPCQRLVSTRRAHTARSRHVKALPVPPAPPVCPLVSHATPHSTSLPPPHHLSSGTEAEALFPALAASPLPRLLTATAPHFLASRAPAQPSLDRGQLHDPRHERPMPRGDGRRAAARIQCPRRRAPRS